MSTTDFNVTSDSELYYDTEDKPVEKVDFVLVWDGSEPLSCSDAARAKRQIFERNLEEEGLILEREDFFASYLHFVKIHAPLEVLKRYTEILKLRMPMKEIPQVTEVKTKNNTIAYEVVSWFNYISKYFDIDPNLISPTDFRFTAIYSRDKEYLFDVDDPSFFTPTIRARVVDFIIKRKRYTEDATDDFAFGIERMKADAVYCAAYPLHDGDLKSPESKRYLLYREWASLSNCFKYQPLDTINEYFGVKIALYFAWLGFYTRMLIPASILGLVCFIYGCITIDDDQHSNDICNPSMNITMCPLCSNCDYWDLHRSCSNAKLTYLFDNDATVVFAFVMSFWIAIYLEYWKRYSAELTHRWDLDSFDVHEEQPRPEYLARLCHVEATEINVITNAPEPRVPYWRMKFPFTLFSVSMVLLLICLAFAAVVAVVAYRVALNVVVLQHADKNPDFRSWGPTCVSLSAAVINLAFIWFFNAMYGSVSIYLTEMELHRNQAAFDDSFTLKIYLLQFVNNYSSIFYIAFFKGKFVGYPAKYNKLLNIRQEECGPGGCMAELCIQLAIIMVGKQAWYTIVEIINPLIAKCRMNSKITKDITEHKSVKSAVFNTQWLKDIKLLEWNRQSLLNEYLEMVLQYGFITIFVAAFPLAPLFAFLNNLLEIRFDAKKLIEFYRRPVAQRVKSIGIWYRILKSIGQMAVVTNAFIIAFTSNFIPKLVYKYAVYNTYDPRYGTLIGFLNHSLTVFDTSHLESKVKHGIGNVKFCSYPDYRYSYTENDDIRYEKTDFHSKIWIARLAFVVVFQNVVAFCVIMLQWLIPDVPKKLEDRIRKEHYITNEIIIKQEMLRARGIYSGGDTTAWNLIAGAKNLELLCVPRSTSI